MLRTRAFFVPRPVLMALVAGLTVLLVQLGGGDQFAAGATEPVKTGVSRSLDSPAVDELAAGPRRSSSGRRLALRASQDGRRSGSAIKVRVRAAKPIAVDGRERLAHRTARGTRHTLRAWVRATAPGQRAKLVGRELRGRSLLQKRSMAMRLRPGTWVPINVSLRTRHSGSRFAIQLLVSGQKPDPGTGSRSVKVDDVVVVIQPDPQLQPQPDPEPDPEPQPVPEPCTISPRGVPSCGSYLGMSYGSNTEPSSAESEFGGTVAVRRTYFRHDNTDKAITIARGDLVKGRLPWMSFKLPYSWDRMAAGDGDVWARNLVARLGSLPGPVWVAFHHEPEGDGPIQDWRRMQERLGPIVRSAPNLGFTVIVTGWHQFYGDAQYSLGNIWPRNTQVDVAGFDIYNSLGVVKNGKENTTGTDLPRAYFDKIAPWAAQQGVAWGLAETGYTHQAAELDPHWLPRTYQDLEAAGGVAFAYFNTTLNSIAPWDLSTQPKKDAFTRALTGTLRLSGR